MDWEILNYMYIDKILVKFKCVYIFLYMCNFVFYFPKDCIKVWLRWNNDCMDLKIKLKT